MLIPDPRNKDESYIYAVTTNNLYILQDDFESFYENTLDKFEDTLEDKVSNLLGVGDIHPDKKLSKYDTETTKYLNKIHSFFEEKAQYYGEIIWEYYQDNYYNYVITARQDYVIEQYQDDLEEYILLEEERAQIKKLTTRVKKIIKDKSPIKQADVVKQFPKEEQSWVKNIILELLKKGIILRGRADIEKRTAWILTYAQK